MFGFFGKSKQVSHQLNKARFDFEKSQANLRHAQEQILELEAKLEELLVEQKRITRLAAEDLLSEKEKTKAALKDQQEESSLLFKQLHQVQEDLEKLYIDRKDLEKQTIESKSTKNKAEAMAVELKKKVEFLEESKAESEKKATEAFAKALSGEKKVIELEKAKAESDKKAAEAFAKALSGEKKVIELEKAKAESDKKAAEAFAKALSGEKKVTELEKAKAESDKKAADLSAQLQTAISKLPQQNKSLQESQQESEQLLKQLLQVQEELESYFHKNKEIDQKCILLQKRLDRILTRLIFWADAETFSATEIINEKNHRCVRLEMQNLWVGQDVSISKLSLLLGRRDGVPYMEFRPSVKEGQDGVPHNLLPWPEDFKDDQGDRFLLAPGAPGAFGKAQAMVVSALSASQWRLVRGLLVLTTSQVNRLNMRERADRMYWINNARDLMKELDSVSTGVHIESVEVMSVNQPELGTEVMRLAVRDLSSRNTRVPLCVFDLGIKYKKLKAGHLSQMFFIDFRPWKGAVMPFVSFKPNSQDEQGEFLRISLVRGVRKINKIENLDLDIQDWQFVGHIGSALIKIAANHMLKHFSTSLGQEFWMKELQEVGGFLSKITHDAEDI
jgi:hypothetical protein